MTIRGGGHPKQAMVSTPFSRMGPPPRSFAADAHDCIMVRDPLDRPNTRLWRDDPCPMASSPSDRRGSAFAEQLVLEAPDSVRRVAETGMVGRRDQANRATVPPAHIAMLTRLDAKTRPARSETMAVVRSRAISAETA